MKLIITVLLNNKAYLAVLAVAVVANVVIIATVTQCGPNIATVTQYGPNVLYL